MSLSTNFGRASDDKYKRLAHETLDRVRVGEPVLRSEVDWALEYLGEPTRQRVPMADRALEHVATFCGGRS